MPSQKQIKSQTTANSQLQTSLVKDDQIHEELSVAYLGSFAVDVCLIDKSLHNQIIDKNFCERLKKSFCHDIHCYVQDDCLRITVTADEFTTILAHYFNMHHLSHDLSSVKR